MTIPQIIAAAKAAIGLRNDIKNAIAANEHIVNVPAVAATATSPAIPASTKPTGQLAVAAGFAHNLAVQLISQLKLVSSAAEQTAIKELETLLNSPAPAPAKPATPTTAPATNTTPSAKVN